MAEKNPKCHISKGPLCLSKPIAEMGKTYYQALVAYYKATKWVALYNTEECMMNALEAEYVYAFKQIGSDDDDDQFGLYLFLGIAIGAVFVIAILLLVIYFKRRQSDDSEAEPTTKTDP